MTKEKSKGGFLSSFFGKDCGSGAAMTGRRISPGLLSPLEKEEKFRGVKEVLYYFMLSREVSFLMKKGKCSMSKHGEPQFF